MLKKFLQNGTILSSSRVTPRCSKKDDSVKIKVVSSTQPLTPHSFPRIVYFPFVFVFDFVFCICFCICICCMGAVLSPESFLAHGIFLFDDGFCILQLWLLSIFVFSFGICICIWGQGWVSGCSRVSPGSFPSPAVPLPIGCALPIPNLGSTPIFKHSDSPYLVFGI